MIQTPTEAGIAQNPMLCDVDSILQLFVGDDELRASMMKPFVIDDYAMATDAHSLVFFDKSIWENQKPFTDKDKNTYLSVIPTIKNLDKKIQLSELEAAFSKIDLIDEEIEEVTEKDCSDCDGDGQVEWEFGSHSKTDDCPNCDGSGTIEETNIKLTGKKVPNPEKRIKIGVCYFRIYELQKIISTCKILAETEFNLVYQLSSNKISWFIVGFVNILTMPVMVENDNEAVAHIA